MKKIGEPKWVDSRLDQVGLTGTGQDATRYFQVITVETNQIGVPYLHVKCIVIVNLFL